MLSCLACLAPCHAAAAATACCRCSCCGDSLLLLLLWAKCPFQNPGAEGRPCACSCSFCPASDARTLSSSAIAVTLASASVAPGGSAANIAKALTCSIAHNWKGRCESSAATREGRLSPLSHTCLNQFKVSAPAAVALAACSPSLDSQLETAASNSLQIWLLAC